METEKTAVFISINSLYDNHYHREKTMEKNLEKFLRQKLQEMKSSNPNSVAYNVTKNNHDTYPEWGPANHDGDPSKDFGTAATRSSALAAIKAYRQIRAKHGKVDINNPEHLEHMAKAIHGSPDDFGGKPMGWSKSAIELGEPHQTPEKKARRAQLTGKYDTLSEPEKEKDRVIARTVINHFKK